MQYVVVIEKSNNGYSAYVPDLPGCVAAADARDETDKLIREAIEFHLEEMRADNEATPNPPHPPSTSRRRREACRLGAATFGAQ